MAVGKEAVWVCYLLQCRDGTLYCGITNDLDKRLAQHDAGQGAKYTRGRAPVLLVWSEPCGDRAEASRRERQVKALSRVQKLALCGLTRQGETR